MAKPRHANEALFYLVPQDAESRKIVEENPSYQYQYKGIVSLQVKAGNKSNFAGRILSIGRLKQLSDIVLYLRGLPDQQCSFKLYPSGELMLQDATTGCHTSIRSSPNAPVVPVDLDKKPLRQIHTYKVLGEGGFDKVSKAVNLASGILYAVK
ncbi:LOW QUALITY PROTEIN: hypothetical protein QC763_0001410 [Podospora pseudopauciseta]|uniref:Uncharacterized protein n=1 Tax=Podospora pseudopauciseta TaxID=2093780 RepID=A0ABR0HWB7_9PEZI|nr:LOW QUALITY PROTEIN: hypothetical protein QC763_0001410 [Podospora pseudopauciseta]